MTARDSLRRAVAAEFQRLDAHQFGYDHGFCADLDADPETAAFVDAAIRVVAEEFAVRLEAFDRAEAAALVRRMADAAAPASGHSCGNCDGIDPGTCLNNPDRTKES